MSSRTAAVKSEPRWGSAQKNPPSSFSENHCFRLKESHFQDQYINSITLHTPQRAYKEVDEKPHQKYNKVWFPAASGNFVEYSKYCSTLPLKAVQNYIFLLWSQLLKYGCRKTGLADMEMNMAEPPAAPRHMSTEIQRCLPHHTGGQSIPIAI